MTAEEKESYPAVKRDIDCMQPVVAAAKRAGNLTDDRVLNLGTACPAELQQAAQSKAARPDVEPDNPNYRKMTLDEKISFQRKQLSGVFWCDLRKCQLTD